MAQEYKHILVPVDGSKEAELAFKKAVAVAKRNGADTELRLLHVVDTRDKQIFFFGNHKKFYCFEFGKDLCASRGREYTLGKQ